MPWRRCPPVPGAAHPPSSHKTPDQSVVCTTDWSFVDIISTFLGAFLIQYLLKLVNIEIRYIWMLLGLFVAGIILHRLFCVRTTIDKLLFN